MSAILNLGSLILGIIAWIIPIASIIQYQRNHKRINFSLYSFTLCSMALVFQLFEISNRINLEDFIAIMDTIEVTSIVSVILVVITFVLNLTANRICSTSNKY